MNILLTNTNTDYIRDLYNVLTKLNQSLYMWTPQHQSIYAILDNDIKIDYLFCESLYINQTLLNAIKEYNIKTVVFGLTDNFEQKVLTCIDADMSKKISGHITSPIYIIEPAANIVVVPTIPEFDVLYICDKFNETEIKNLYELQKSNIQFKIIGKFKLPFIEYVGNVDTVYRLALCKAAKITILNNKEYIYDIAINKKMGIISQDNDIYPTFTSPTNLLEQVEHYLKNEKQMLSIGKAAYQKAIQNTYYHCASKIFQQLNLNELSEQCLTQLSKVLV